MRLNVDLSDIQERELAAIAERLRVSPEVLASAVLRDLLSQPDQQFQLAAESVLAKNVELYRRLA